MSWSILVIIFQLIFLEGILSIDNAAVLGAMVVDLPDDIPVHWPHALTRLGHALHPLVGNQRTAALRVGILGAYVGRGTMLFLATLIVQNPWLKLIGAAYLIHLAFDNLGLAEPGEEDAHIHPLKLSTFWVIVLNVEIADLVFSIDNVVAAVSLSNQLWVVITGVSIGILLMRFAAGLFSYLVEKEPVLKSAAYILILNIGIELVYAEITGLKINEWLQFGISILTLLLALAYAHFSPLHKLRPALVWMAEGFANVNELVDWSLKPPIGLVRLVSHQLKKVFLSNKSPKKSPVSPVEKKDKSDGEVPCSH